MNPNQLYLLPSGMVSVQPLAVSASEELASVIVLKDVSKHYGSVAVLDHLSMNVAAGAYLALGGASGAGKTTLLGILGLLEPPTSGEYFFAECRLAVLMTVSSRNCGTSHSASCSSSSP